MTHKHLTLIFAALVVTFNLMAQESPSEKAFLKKLIEQEYNTPQDVRAINLTKQPYSVSLGEEDDPYTVYYSIIAHEDLNEDGIDDYIIFRNSEGMLGGNGNTNQQYLFLIMKNDAEVLTKYEILAYAPFSYNIINETNYHDKRLTAEVVKNFRTYYMDDNEQTASLAFIYKNNNLYEESYLTDCDMANMKDKAIFRTDLPDVKRELNIEPNNYTEVVLEEYIQGDTIISASLGGCDNLTLHFGISVNVAKGKLSPSFYRKTALEIFDILVARTRYKTILNKVAADYKNRNHEWDKVLDATINDTWSYYVTKFYYDESTNRLKFTIGIKNIANPNQEENWDITIRNKLNTNSDE